MSRVALAVGGAALVLIGGAVLTWGTPDSAEGRSTPVTGVERVRIDGRSGDVRIRHEPGGTGDVEQTVRRWGLFGREAPEHRVDGGTLVLDGDCGWWCSVEYDVVLPAAVPVDGHVGSGDVHVTGMRSVRVEVGSGGIEATGVQRSVDARTGSGSIAVRDARGPVQVRSGSGQIELASIGGDLRARTGSGQIRGDDIAGERVRARSSSGGVDLGLTGPREAELSTGSGRIEVTVPPDRYRVDSETGSRDVDIGVVRDPDADRRLELSTGSGGIRVAADEG
ncbi:DUF4097 family beta strand repeat-containing protein [Saccharopolyspora griseoalba]|uniref:DUF4097 domain-containing protein n=1 Tax=Saccharopolyspora griseoalba TaxID=1431848 RepID=A0ABW2LTK6_9PSEU